MITVNYSFLCKIRLVIDGVKSTGFGASFELTADTKIAVND